MAKQNQLWTVQEDFVLMSLVGRETHAQIALRLGRSETAVQRRASMKGWHAKAEKRNVKKHRSQKIESLKNENLCASVETLAEFLPKVD